MIILKFEELEHILMSNGEPMKQSDLDEVFKVVSLHNGTDIDYEGKSFKNITV